jgi:hypothetical protein
VEEVLQVVLQINSWGVLGLLESYTGGLAEGNGGGLGKGNSGGLADNTVLDSLNNNQADSEGQRILDFEKTGAYYRIIYSCYYPFP